MKGKGQWMMQWSETIHHWKKKHVISGGGFEGTMKEKKVLEAKWKWDVGEVLFTPWLQ